MTTWASLGLRIDELEREVNDKDLLREQQAEVIKALRGNNAILRGRPTRDEEHERVDELEEQLRASRTCNHILRHKNDELRHEVAILNEYKRAVLILADAWDALCVLFEGRPS